MTELSIKAAAIRSFSGKTFPKYTTQIMNLISNTGQATRPRVVGQMSALVAKFVAESPTGTVKDWKRWYLAQHPTAIDDATDKILAKLGHYKEAIDRIDRPMICRWVEDLVIAKSFKGTQYHVLIIRSVPQYYNMPCRFASPAEENKGIDGFERDIPFKSRKGTANRFIFLWTSIHPGM